MTETNLYFAHMFALLAAVGAYTWPKGRLIARGLIVLAFALLLASIVLRGWGAGRIPLTSMYEFGVLFGLMLTALIVIVERWLDSRILGLVLSAATFVLASVQLLFYQDVRPLMPALKSVWLTSHVFTAVVGYGLAAASFVLSVTGLVWKNAPAKLEGAVNRLIVLAFPFLTLLLVTGAIWAEYAWGSFWRWDPKETWALVTWLIYLAHLHLVRSQGWSGRRVLWLSAGAFVIVVFTFYGVNLLLSGLHSYA